MKCDLCIIVSRRWWRLYIHTTKGLLCVQVTHCLPCFEKHAVFMASRSCVSSKIPINFSDFCVICTLPIESESQCKFQAVWLILKPLICSCMLLHKDLNNPVDGHIQLSLKIYLMLYNLTHMCDLIFHTFTNKVLNFH